MSTPITIEQLLGLVENSRITIELPDPSTETPEWMRGPSTQYEIIDPNLLLKGLRELLTISNKVFDIGDEEDIWAEFLVSKRVTVSHSDDSHENFCDVIYGQYDDVFYAGYVSEHGELSDCCNIPEEVFEKMFEGKLPAGLRIEWNGSAAHHTPHGKLSITKVMDIVRPVFNANGFKEDVYEDC